MDQLRPYFKVPSDVDVTLKERHYWLDVRGLVQKPARFLVEPGTSLDEVIGLAGGFSKETPPAYVRFQKGNKVLVINLNQYYSQAFDHPQLLGWVGGEVIFFQKDISVLTVEHPSSALYRPPVHVLGEVKKPGDYPLESGSDLVDTIVEAGGFTDRADLDNIEMIRKTLTGKRTRRLSWDNLSGAPALQQGDIVIVHADIVTRSERRITMWATVISVLATIVTAWVLVAAYNKGRI
jgi:protein involved in polysaccharide export with SLBB domain